MFDIALKRMGNSGIMINKRTGIGGYGDMGMDQGEKAVCMIVGGFVGMILSGLLISLLGIGSIILLIIAFFLL